MSWQRIVPDDDVTTYTAIAASCSRALFEYFDAEIARPSSPSAAPEPSLLLGYSGIALLGDAVLKNPHLVQYLETSHDEVQHFVTSIVRHAASDVANRVLEFDFERGLAGLGWLFQLLREYVDESVHALNDDIDGALLSMLRARTNMPSEMFRGIAGVALYFADRPRSGLVDEALGVIVDRLHKSAIWRADEVTWFTPPSQLHRGELELAPAGFYNLGVPHGVPGIIGALSRLAALRRHDLVDDMISGAVTWLLRMRDQSCKDGMQFPGVVTADGHRIKPGLAWCYSDLGIATLLLAVSQLMRRSDWADHAIDIARHVAELGIAPATARRDTNLCHGGAGIAHMFARFFTATNDDCFRRAAQLWFHRTICLRREGEFIGGFGTWTLSTNDLAQRAGLLDGTTGVALGLLAALGGPDPSWDRALLMSP